MLGMHDVIPKVILLNRPVAVKILHDQFKSDTEFIDKFNREAQAAARLSHPNIVNIYDVGVMDDAHYIVMEYVPGKTLKQLDLRGKYHINVAAVRSHNEMRSSIDPNRPLKENSDLLIVTERENLKDLTRSIK